MLRARREPRANKVVPATSRVADRFFLATVVGGQLIVAAPRERAMITV
jgi:hypothetical protein